MALINGRESESPLGIATHLKRTVPPVVASFVILTLYILDNNINVEEGTSIFSVNNAVSILTVYILFNVIVFLRIKHTYMIFLALVVVLVPITFTQVIPSDTQIGDTRYALSNGAYIGYSPSAPSSIWFFSLVTVGCLALYVQYRTKTSKTGVVAAEPHHENISSSSFKSHDRLPERLVLALFALVTMPNLLDHLAFLKNPSWVSHWDYNQINAWLAFASFGYTPMNDYWMPYGGITYLMDGIAGPILVWILLTLGLLILIKLYGRLKLTSIQRNLLLVFTFITYYGYVIYSDDPVRFIRYIIPSIFLAYVLSAPTKIKDQIISSLPISIVILFGTEISVAVLVIQFLSFFAVSFALRSFDVARLWSFLIPLISLTTVVCIKIYDGSLASTFLMLSNPKELEQYVYYPKVVLDFAKISSGDLTLFETTAALVPFLLIFFGIVTLLQVRASKSDVLLNLAVIVISASLLSIISIQKTMYRGGMNDVIILTLIPIIIFAMALSLTSGRQSWMLGVFPLIILIALFVQMPQKIFTSYTDIPYKLKSNVSSFKDPNFRELLFHADWKAAAASSELNSKLNKHLDLQGLTESEVYVLGDLPGYYPSLEQAPFWTITSFNTSPISIQEKLLKQIDSRKPGVILFDHSPETLGFDQTPTQLRLANMFRYIVLEYQFQSTLGNIDVLVPKTVQLDRKQELNYWRSRLGTELTIGHTMQASEPSSKIETCVKQDSNCNTYITSGIEFPIDGKISLTCSDLGFEISYLSFPSNSLLPTERIWFWDDSCTLTPESIAVGWEILRSNTPG